MTLPNRPGYVVSDKKNPPSQQSTPQHQPQTPTHENINPKIQMAQQQPTMHQGYDMEQLGSLAPPQQYYQPNPYAQQQEMMRMAERGGYEKDSSVDVNPNPFKAVDPFRQQLSDPTQARVEEMVTRKQFIKYHRLLSPMVDLLTYCKKEGIIPPIATDTDVQASRMSDFGLDDFINSQGIELSPLYTEDQKKNQERQEFVEKLEQLKMKYNEELEKLNRVLSEFCTRAVAILQEQSQFRTVTELETHLKVLGIQQKFDYVRNQLRQNVCNAILVLQKQYNQMRKKRRTLSKRATEGLTNWFFEHLNDPYPSEEEKSMLAAHGGLTITQVNNWFGNKRIRYKRKCLAEENKRASGGQSTPNNQSSNTQASSPLSSSSSPLPTPITNPTNNPMGQVPNLPSPTNNPFNRRDSLSGIQMPMSMPMQMPMSMPNMQIPMSPQIGPFGGPNTTSLPLQMQMAMSQPQPQGPQGQAQPQPLSPHHQHQHYLAMMAQVNQQINSQRKVVGGQAMQPSNPNLSSQVSVNSSGFPPHLSSHSQLTSPHSQMNLTGYHPTMAMGIPNPNSSNGVVSQDDYPSTPFETSISTKS